MNDPVTMPAVVGKEFPPIHTVVVDHWEITGYNAQGFPIAKPDGATLGHALLPGEVVKLIVPQPSRSPLA